ncbi:MAG: hypothetical protein PHN49_10410 [Candidatus Omnitrophica bacterium]|nr:hypothetical protein [Candidatus Omnitrophota bacterium]MDD5672042.1 hypothetical protein [Candidatus Omnitrophota bacterium]
MHKKIYLLGLISTLSVAILLAVAGLMKPVLMVFFLSKGSYYILFILFFYWVVTLGFYFRANHGTIQGFLRSYGWGMLFIWLLCVFVFISAKPYLRVLNDENSLLSVSQSMVYYKQCDCIIESVRYADVFMPLKSLVPRRPLLFPFFIHLLHALTGYRIANVFVLNFFVLGSLLSLIYVFFKRRLGAVWACTAVLFVAAQPLVVSTATSGGFDLFAVLFLVIAFGALLAFMKAPSAIGFRLLWVNLLMLAHTRYEMPLILVIVTTFLVIFRYVKREYFSSSLIYGLTPLILLPILWHRILAEPPYQQLVGYAPFSLDYFISNSRLFFENLIGSRKIPVAFLINLFGVLGLADLIFLFAKKDWPKNQPQVRFVLIAGSCLLVLWAIVASFYYAVVTNLYCTRYFTVFYILLSLTAVFFLHRVGIFFRRPLYLITLAVILFLISNTASAQWGYTNLLHMTRRHRFVMDFLEKQGWPRFLLIVNTPGQYTCYDYGAIFFSTANTSKAKVLRDYETHLYDNIFVVQEIAYSTLKPSDDMVLDADYQLETLAEMRSQSSGFTRISRVKKPMLKTPMDIQGDLTMLT